MPARVWSGSGQQNYWCGIYVLGPLMGVKRADNSGQAQLDALDRIAKILDCPSVNRTKDPVSPFVVDYTYNTNLGDDRAIQYNGDGSPNSSYTAAMAPWAQFKKRTQVPGNVIVALDGADQVSKDDERFGALADLTTASASRPWPRGGHPHQQNKGNVLFHGGQVILLKAFEPKPGNPQPMTFDPTTTKLENWMILAPGNLDPAATYYGTTQGKRENVWQKGVPLPEP
jgi:hypothetical protein